MFWKWGHPGTWLSHGEWVFVTPMGFWGVQGLKVQEICLFQQHLRASDAYCRSWPQCREEVETSILNTESVGEETEPEGKRSVEKTPCALLSSHFSQPVFAYFLLVYRRKKEMAFNYR